jgi:hypothetical protein
LRKEKVNDSQLKRKSHERVEIWSGRAKDFSSVLKTQRIILK